MSNPLNADSLPSVLHQSQQVKQHIEANSRDLFVVNEVLKQEIPGAVKAAGDVAAALERSESIQGNLDAVADELDDINQALVREVARRKIAEQKLCQSKVDLADAQAQLAYAHDQ